MTQCGHSHSGDFAPSRHNLVRGRHLHSLQATDANVCAFGDDTVAEDAAGASRVFDPEAARQTRHNRQCADLRAVRRDENMVARLEIHRFGKIRVDLHLCLALDEFRLSEILKPALGTLDRTEPPGMTGPGSVWRPSSQYRSS
jgi:hypothetical protein